MNSGLNAGDIIFQLFALGIPIIFIAAILSLWRTSKKRKQQLDRIEAKLDSIQKNSGDGDK